MPRLLHAIRRHGPLILLAHVIASYVCLIAAVLVFEPQKMVPYLLPMLAAPVSMPVALAAVTMGASTVGIIFCWTAYLAPFSTVLLMRQRLGKVGGYRAFTVAAVIACALVLGLGISGARSFTRASDAGVGFDTVSLHAQSARGEVTLSLGFANQSYGVNGGVDELPLQWADRSREMQGRIVDNKFSVLGFALRTGDPSRRHPNGVWIPISLTAPYWFFVLVMLALAWWILRQRGRWLRRERKQQGLCETCGYDLRESHGRCPECGTDILARLWLLVSIRMSRLWMGG